LTAILGEVLLLTGPREVRVGASPAGQGGLMIQVERGF
jgi:hypothetical protein